MKYKIKTRDEHFANDNQPKRILALDGGGLRGILTTGILQKIEKILREQNGESEEFRLCHYFDLIAGTSTGAIIAAALALDWKVEDIQKTYMELGKAVFQKSLLRNGLLRAKYDEDKLIEELQKFYGISTNLGSNDLNTGLLIVTKRLDTGSPWPISNNPRGKYYASRPGGVIGNGDYPLWQTVRASSAAPLFFESENITVSKKEGYPDTVGEFIDGGASPFNNPSLQALMYATLDGYRIGWPTGAEKIQLVSVGSGAADPEVERNKLAAKHAINSLLSLMDDSAVLQETILQWLSTSPTARVIDREVGDLRHDLVANAPLLSYLRYNVDLRKEAVQALDPSMRNSNKIENLSAMDDPKNMEILYNLGILAGERDVKASDFASNFDLPEI